MQENKNIVIFDLDGTLALIDHRRHYIECPREKQDWDAFYEACDKDDPNQQIIRLFVILSFKRAYNTVIFSGRSESVREKTIKWLCEHVIDDYDWINGILKMRPEGDFTPDDILKRQWAEEIGIDRIAMVFDDRSKVVKMWRSLGITCLQVAEGEF